MTLGFLALATALTAVHPLNTPTKLFKGLKRPQIKTAAALVSSLTVDESVLKGEAAGLCELIDKCQGHLIAHVQSGDFWDCARVRNGVACPLEFKVVRDLDCSGQGHEGLRDYLNIETDCGWVDVKKKDWILMLGNKQRKRDSNRLERHRGSLRRVGRRYYPNRRVSDPFGRTRSAKKLR